MVSKKQTSVQLTIRGIPADVGDILRNRAQLERKSLNAILVEVLKGAASAYSTDMRHTDLDDLFGRWQDDPDCDEALRAQD